MIEKDVYLKCIDPYNMETRVEIRKMVDDDDPNITCSLYVGEDYEGGLAYLTLDQVKEIRDCCNKILEEVKQ